MEQTVSERPTDTRPTVGGPKRRRVASESVRPLGRSAVGPICSRGCQKDLLYPTTEERGRERPETDAHTEGGNLSGSIASAT